MTKKNPNIPIDEIEHLGLLTQIPWSHNTTLMEKIDNVEQRLWYAAKTVENNLGKRALEDWIDRDIYPSLEEIEQELNG